MSTAWYKSNRVPKLIKEWSTTTNSVTNSTSSPLKRFAAVDGQTMTRRSIEVWDTTCIVTNFGRATEPSNCQVLINPANPNLTGVSKFPYFPRGGPEPTLPPSKDAHHIMGYVRFSCLCLWLVVTVCLCPPFFFGTLF